MNTGFERYTLVFEVNVDRESLISRLLTLKEQASAVAAEANRIISDLQQATEIKAEAMEASASAQGRYSRIAVLNSCRA